MNHKKHKKQAQLQHIYLDSLRPLEESFVEHPVLKKEEDWFTLISIPISSQMDRSVCAVVKRDDEWASLLSDIPSSTADMWYLSHTTKKKVSNYTFIFLCFIVFFSISEASSAFEMKDVPRFILHP